MLTTLSDNNSLLSNNSIQGVDDNNEEDEEIIVFSHHKKNKRRIVSSASSSPEPALSLRTKGRKKASHNPNRKDKAGRTKLFYATTAGHIDKVRELISQGAQVNFKDNAGWTPLHEAALKGQFEIGKYLIECGADVNVRGFGDDTPLHDASCNGFVDFVQLLVDAGADVFALNDDKQRPIDVCEDVECQSILQNKMKKLDRLIAKDKDGRSLLHRACIDKKLDRAQLLLEQGADVNAKDNQDYTPLHLACIHGHLNLVKLLIEHGAVINISSNTKSGATTPLHEASKHGHEEVVQYLLSNTNVDVNMENGEGKNAYHLAAPYPFIRQILTARMDEVRLEKEASKALDEIASRTASINEPERQLTREEKKIQSYMKVFANLEGTDKKEENYIAFKKKRRMRKMSASVESDTQSISQPNEKKSVDISKLDPFKTDTSGRTLLYKYIVKGNIEIVGKLLEMGSNPNEKDYAGWSPIHEAALRGKADIVRLLLKYGADVNLLGADMDTPLHDATENNHYDVVEILLEHGADPYSRNINDAEPIDIATDHNYEDIILLLNSYLAKKKRTKIIVKEEPVEVDFKKKRVEDIRLKKRRSPALPTKQPKKRRLVQAADLEKLKNNEDYKLIKQEDSVDRPKEEVKRYIPSKKNLYSTTCDIPVITTRDPHSPIPTPPPEPYSKEKEDARKFTPLYSVQLQESKMFYVIDLQVSLFLGMQPDIFWKNYPHLPKRIITREEKERLWSPLRPMLHEDKSMFIDRKLHFINLDDIVHLIKNDFNYLKNSFITIALDISYGLNVDNHKYAGLPPKIAMKMKKCGYKFYQHTSSS
ncbi:ankyrin repeat-containing domain protein [Pilobolus umbonatus]|nr:ankyrin repeat-containing domain protein [Pilobolus umbonatus]